MEVESFMIDAIVVENLKYPGDFKEIARAIYEKLNYQYGCGWSVLISKFPKSPESGYCITYVPGSNIDLTYDGHLYTIFKSS